jgi:phage terminase large subunit
LTRHRFSLRDNPYLSPEFVRALELEYVGLWRRRFIDGDWVVAEGAIYDMFNPEVHSVDWPAVPSGRWRAVGIDYGTTNPTVFLALTQLDDGRLIVHDEWRWNSKKEGRQLTMKEHSDHYFEWKRQLGQNRDTTGQKVDRVACDPSANSFILQLWRDGERSVKPADNDVINGIMEISSLMQRERLLFHAPTTRLAMEEMSSYVWDSDASLKGEDKPLKLADHAPDALRYAIRGTRMRWRAALAT